MANIDIVMGACAGDEGKGTITARIAKLHKEQKVVNVLTNGGAQRGHTVVVPSAYAMAPEVITYKHFGSGTSFGAISYYPKEFILNPMQFAEEASQLRLKGIKAPIAIRSPACRWTTPWDMMRNQIISKLDWFGTCGMGIWATICRFTDSELNIPFDEFMLLAYDKKVGFLKQVRDYCFAGLGVTISNGDEVVREYRDAYWSEDTIKHFIDDCTYMWTNTTCSDAALDLNNYDHIIFESGQGLLLSDEGKDDPEKTPSYTGLRGIRKNDFIFRRDDNVKIHYVTRPYLTRHGSEKFEDKKVDGDIDKSSEVNIYNEFQKDFKYNDLDIIKLDERIATDLEDINLLGGVNYSVELDITHCDELDREKEFREFYKNNKNVDELVFSGERKV